MKFLNNDKVLCLSPHPDDVEYSMAGTILKFKDTQFDIAILTMGGDVDVTRSIKRFEEVKNFWKDVENVKITYLKNLQPNEYSDDVAIDMIENEYDMSTYNSIFIPSKEDTHFYHRKINSLGKSLCRVAKFNLYEYFTPSAEPSWIPNLIVEIDRYQEKKDRLKEFKTQTFRRYFSDFCLDAFHTDLHFNKKGFEWIEKFKVINQNL